MVRPCRKLAYCGRTMVYHGISWYTMVNHGISCCTMVYHGKPESWYTIVNHGMPWYTMVHHGTTAMCYDIVVYHSIPCLHHGIAWWSWGSSQCSLGIFIHALLSRAYLCISYAILLLTDPTMWHTDRWTDMGRYLAAKEGKCCCCIHYWPMYSAVVWQQFSLAGGHDEQ